MAKSKTPVLDAIGELVTDSLTAPLAQISGALGKLKDVSDAVFGSLNKLSGAVQSSIGTYTQLFNPAATKLLDRAVMDLNASIGQALMPALEIATSMMRSLGSVIASLSPNSQKLLVALVLSSVAAVAAAAATGTLTAMVTALAISENAATLGLSGLVAAVATFVTSLAIGATVLAAVNKPLAMFDKLFQDMASGFESVMDLIGDAFQKMAVAAEPLLGVFVNLMKSGISNLGTLIVPLVETFAGLMQQMSPIFEKLLPTLASLVFTFQNLFVLTIQVVGYALRPLLLVFDLLIKQIAFVVDGFLFVVNAIISVVRSFVNFGSKAEDSILGPFSKISSFLNQTFGPAINRMKEALFSVGVMVGDVVGAIFKLVGTVIGRFASAFAPIADFVVRFVVTGLQLLAYVIEQTANAIEFLIRNLRDLLGVADSRPEGRKVDPNAATGLAIRQAQTGSVQSFIDRARTAAFSAGRGSNPAADTAKNTEDTARNTATMAQNIAAMVSDVRLIKDGVISVATNPLKAAGDAGRYLLGIPNKSAGEMAGEASGLALRQAMQFQG